MEKSKNNEVSITKVSVKKPDDVKSFTESTMNEILGWYGYDSSRQETKIPKNCRYFSNSNDSEGESVKFTDGCGWCGKTVDENTSVISATAVFCSELCFSQSRRASFKRNKTCDWCRHARHSVSYVDFQENSAQLQFCSDKCLNQYKMHIFCRETQAHLELYPHVHGTEPGSGNLITPDLWMRNCSSPKPSRSSPSLSPRAIDSASQNMRKSPTSTVPMPEPLPLISVAPTTKLLATDVKRNRSKNPRRFKKGCPSTITSVCDPAAASNDIPQDLRIRQTPPVNEADADARIFKASPKREDTRNIRVSFDDSQEIKKNITEQPDDVFSKSRLTSNNVRAILSNILPPPTTFVPYPVILPLPIPIPIPIPIPKMFKSNNGKELIELKDNMTQTDTINNNNIIIEEDNRAVVKKEPTTIILSGNRRLLRKRKHGDNKPRIFHKHKKTLPTLP